MALKDSFWHRNNINKEVTAGIDIATINSLGPAPWETPSTGLLYVGGRYCDDGPLAGLLWAELRREYPRLHLSHRHATWFEMDLMGVSHVRTAAMFSVTQQAVQNCCASIKRYIEQSPNRGLVTSIVEEFGWAGLRWILRGR